MARLITNPPIGSTPIPKLLSFSGNKETKEYKGTKHIGATDLLREMARRRAANPAWDNAAAIGHCVICQELQERRGSMVGGSHTIRQQFKEAQGGYHIMGTIKNCLQTSMDNKVHTAVTIVVGQ
jgi:hypothetical protein